MKNLKRVTTWLMFFALLSGAFVPCAKVFALVTDEEVQEVSDQMGKEVENVSGRPCNIFEDSLLFRRNYSISPGEKVFILQICREIGVAKIRVNRDPINVGYLDGFISFEQLLLLIGKPVKEVPVQDQVQDLLPQNACPITCFDYKNLVDAVVKATNYALPSQGIHEANIKSPIPAFQLVDPDTPLETQKLSDTDYLLFRELVDGILPSVDVSADQANLTPAIYIFGIPRGFSWLDVPSCLDPNQRVRYTINSSFHPRFSSLPPKERKRILYLLLWCHQIFIEERDVLIDRIPAFLPALESQRELFPHASQFELVRLALVSLGEEDLSLRMPYSHELFINFFRASDDPRVPEANCKNRLLLTMESSIPILSRYLQHKCGFNPRNFSLYKSAYRGLWELAGEQIVYEFATQGIPNVVAERHLAAEQYFARFGVNNSQRPYDSSLDRFVPPELAPQLLNCLCERFLTLENVHTILQKEVKVDPGLEEKITELFSTKQFNFESLCTSLGILGVKVEELRNIFLDVGRSNYARDCGIGQEFLDFAQGEGTLTFHKFLTATNPQGLLLALILQNTALRTYVDSKRRYNLEVVDGELKDFDEVYAHSRAIFLITGMMEEGILISLPEHLRRKEESNRRLQERRQRKLAAQGRVEKTLEEKEREREEAKRQRAVPPEVEMQLQRFVSAMQSHFPDAPSEIISGTLFQSRVFSLFSYLVMMIGRSSPGNDFAIQKQSVWMPMAYPLIKGYLENPSPLEKTYELQNLKEGRAYLEIDILQQNLFHMVDLLIQYSMINGKSAEDFLQGNNLHNFHSSVTFFYEVANEVLADGQKRNLFIANITGRALNTFFSGRREPRTLAILAQMSTEHSEN